MFAVDASAYAVYASVAAVMAVTPGPANLFAIAAGAQHGARPALIAIAGMNLATLVWFTGAALGLAGLMRAAPAAFDVLRVGGGLYVGFLGLRAAATALSAAHPAQDETTAPIAARRAFHDGFAVQIANPKLALFFAAVLPPFLDPAQPPAAQLALFALATIGFDAAAMCGYGLAGGALAARFRQPRFRRVFGLIVGALLILSAAFILMRG